MIDKLKVIQNFIGLLTAIPLRFNDIPFINFLSKAALKISAYINKNAKYNVDSICEYMKLLQQNFKIWKKLY